MINTVFNEIKKYWLFQGGVLVIIIGYIIILGLGITIVLESPFYTTPEAEEVQIHFWAISEHPINHFNFSLASNVPSNITLLEYINQTLGQENWDGVEFPTVGWFIKRIFNATEGNGWVWLYYYRPSTVSTWILAPVGVSVFRLTQDYDIKFLYTDSS